MWNSASARSRRRAASAKLALWLVTISLASSVS
jgi:hypothetical protein